MEVGEESSVAAPVENREHTLTEQELRQRVEQLQGKPFFGSEPNLKQALRRLQAQMEGATLTSEQVTLAWDANALSVPECGYKLRGVQLSRDPETGVVIKAKARMEGEWIRSPIECKAFAHPHNPGMCVFAARVDGCIKMVAAEPAPGLRVSLEDHGGDVLS